LVQLHLSPEEETYQKLISAYSEKHRAYHSVKHIEDCLAKLDLHSELLEELHAVEMAIWFHDAIYKTRSTSNEVDSAEWASEFLSASGAPSSLVHTVHSLIVATKHDVPLASRDEEVLVDIDLSILGSEADKYRQFEEDVRKEYRLVPWPIFRRKRAEILQSFLGRDFIYNIPQFRDMYEESARTNLKSAVQSLLG